MRHEKYEQNISGQSRAKGFMSGVLLLSLSTLIVKIIGLAFKIPMLSFLGTEGMGYFNSAYEIYALLCTVSTAGLPVALSMLVSSARTCGSGARINKIYKTAKMIFWSFGIVGSLVMAVFAQKLAILIGNPDSYLCILAISPALLFICIASAIRGYCQGFELMAPTAISQLIEALAKLGLGIAFAIIAIDRQSSVPVVSAYAVLGVTVGTFLSAIYLFFAQRRAKRYAGALRRNDISRSGVMTALIRIALPITLGSALIGTTRIIDMTMLMHRLGAIGLSVSQANGIYGAYTTLALPVFSLIPALITPVAMALVPQLASFIEAKDVLGQRTVIENSMRLTVLFAMPSSLALSAFSRPILELLFRGQTYAIDVAAPLLSTLGASVLFSCLITTTNAILQAYRKVSLPIISMFAGVVVKLVLSYVLIGNRTLGAMGAPIGSLACNVTVSVLNLYFMSREQSCIFDLKRIFFKPMWASLMSIGISLAAFVGIDAVLENTYGAFGIAVCVAVVTYVGFSFLVRSVTMDDIYLIPFGERIAKIFENKNAKKHYGGENDGKRNEEGAS